MIPEFNSKGKLPPGIYTASIAEFKERFSFSRQRKSLLIGLIDAMDCLRQAKCKRIYIDGSFVTSTLIPKDFDACWDESGVDLVLLRSVAPELFETRFPRSSQKDRFGGELFPSQATADEYGNNFIEFFQKVKNSTSKKGIIVINL